MTSYGKGSFDGFTSYQGDTQFDGEKGTDMTKLSRDVSSNVQKITQNVSQVQKLLNQISSPKDSDEIRQRIHQRIQCTKQLASETSQHLKKFAQLPSSMSMLEQKKWKMQKERLTEEFAQALKNFQSVQRTAVEKESASIQPTKADSSVNIPAPDNHSQADLMASSGAERRTIFQTKQYKDLELIRERRDALKKLENDIMDVHALFKELGKLVHEQGKVIDRIEDNIDHTRTSLQESNKQLTKAREY